VVDLAGGELPERYDELNVYTRVIVDEARSRGIGVTILDATTGELVLERDGRRVHTIESLSELTSAVAFQRCDDKWLTRQVLADAGLRVPAGQLASEPHADAAFLHEHGAVVVKPRRGEQGWGVSVDLRDADALAAAVTSARSVCADVVLERYHPGDDLRIVVIGGEVVAASVRSPATVVGDGRSTVAELVATLAETRRGLGAEDEAVTRSVVGAAGHSLDEVLPEGRLLAVRRTANVHTGGTIHDVTDRLHPALAEVARRAAAAIDIPVTGLDLIVAAVDGPDYVVIEANEQPGLANHEPRPTVERFVDLLFPV
jgi:GNAT-family acetyltransferase (TIGR03103 family)